MLLGIVRFLVLLLLPLAIYLAWGWYRTRYVAEHGGEAPALEKGPWPMLLFMGALLAVGGLVTSTLFHDGGPGSVAVLGGARLTNESAYAWAKLAKGVLGTDHVDAQLGDGLPAEVVLGLPRGA